MRLKTELASILILTSLFFISIFSIIFYYYARAGFVEQVENQLSSVAEHKKTVVESYLLNRQGEFRTLHSLPVILENLYQFHLTEEEEYLAQVEATLVEYAASMPHVKDVHAQDTNRVIVASSTPHYIGSAYTSPRVKISSHDSENSYFIEKNDTLIFQISTPVHHKNRHIGRLLIEFFAHEIKDIGKDYFGLGQTGETVIAVRNEEGEIIYLFPPRFVPDGQFIPVDTTTDQATLRAMKGEEAFFEEISDYRNESVLAITHYMDYPGWGLITKLDTEEGLRTVHFIRDLTIWIAIIFAIIFITTSYFLSDYLVKPIEKITSAAVRISKGDLSKKVSLQRKNELGTLSKSFNIMTDKLIEAREGLEEKIEELNRSNDSLNRFAYIVSHDLKSPLASITALSDLLKDEYKEQMDEQGQIMFGMLQTKVEHMQQLIDGILQYSRMGNCMGQDVDTDTGAVIDEVFEDASGKKKVNFVKEGDFPKIFINRTCLKQVFQNLVSNSVKYMDKEEGYIKASYSKEGKHHIFTISDNGPGIDPKYHEKIFEIFNTGALTGSKESTGVGLAIVQRIVENYKGSVKIQSAPGEGTAFTICLPI
ncbi:sensor histidine kinase [Cytophagaceae bacterium ABcell3]|nr:sensor histidine kinase [Cytophagaceae bacterium ABcell3]